MRDLFGHEDEHDEYPSAPGFKKYGTSAEAAERISAEAGTLRAKVLAIFRDGHELTADQVAEMLGKSVLSIRPRLSELVAVHLIEPTGRRRLNVSGMSADVMRLVRRRPVLVPEPDPLPQIDRTPSPWWNNRAGDE